MSACYEPPDYRRTHVACKKSSLCPPGLICSEDHCVEPSNDLNAIGPADVEVVANDLLEELPSVNGPTLCKGRPNPGWILVLGLGACAAADGGIGNPVTVCTRCPRSS
jgi:hypothetical protein